MTTVCKVSAAVIVTRATVVASCAKVSWNFLSFLQGFLRSLWWLVKAGGVTQFTPWLYVVLLQGRARLKTGSRSSGGVLAKNPRAGYRPLPTPPPGDPSREGLPRSAMTWTIHADEAASLTAVAVEADDLAWAMVWREADKQGNLSVPRCQALNIMNSKQGPQSWFLRLCTVCCGLVVVGDASTGSRGLPAVIASVKSRLLAVSPPFTNNQRPLHESRP